MQYLKKERNAFAVGKKMLLTASALMVALFFGSVSCRGGYKVPPLKSVVSRLGQGYVYVIYMEERVIIRQDHIPGMDPSRRFCDSLDALKASGEVMERVALEESPNLTREDIQRLGIKSDCLNN